MVQGKKMLLFFLGIGWWFMVQAKPVGPIEKISLDQVLQAAQKANLENRLAMQKLAMVRAAEQYAQAVWLPRIQFTYGAYLTNNPLNAFGFKLQQEKVTAADFNPALLNHPGAVSQFQTQLQILQPLVNPDQWWMKKISAMAVEMAALKAKRGQEAVAWQATQTYLKLQFLQQAQQVSAEAKMSTSALETQVRHKFEQGLVPYAEVLRVGVQVSMIETQEATIRNQQADASDLLSDLMGVEKGKIFEPQPLVLTNTDTVGASLTNRSDLVALKKAMLSQDMVIEATRKSWLPRLNGMAQYQFSDGSALGFGAGAYLAGLQLSWDIFNGKQTKTKLVQQKMEKQQLETQFEQQFTTAERLLLQANRQIKEAQYKQQQQEKAIAQAQEMFRLLQNRFEQGLVTTADLLLAQSQLSQQQLLMAEAKFMEQSAIGYQQFLQPKF